MRTVLERVERNCQKEVIDLRRQVDESRGAREELQTALRRSEVERTELQMSLIRVGFGYAPFAVPEPPVAPEPAASIESDDPLDAIRPDMNPEQVQRIFTQEAVSKYGSTNLRKIRDHVEGRQKDYYQFRQRSPILSDAEREQAKQVARDIEAAIAEGRAEAEKDY